MIPWIFEAWKHGSIVDGPRMSLDVIANPSDLKMGYLNSLAGYARGGCA